MKTSETWPDPLATGVSPESVAEELRAADRKGRRAGEIKDTDDKYSIGPHGAIHGPHVLAWMPLDRLNFEGAPWSPYDSNVGDERLELALKYAERLERGDKTPPPGRCVFGAYAKKKGSRLAFVSDGNHRSLAAFLAGQTHVLMLMPEEDYWRLRSVP